MEKNKPKKSKLSLNHVYDISPETLTNIPNPLFNNKHMRFLTDDEMVKEAQKIIKLIESRNPDVILYSDTGVRPLIYICQLLIEKRNASKALKAVPWQPIKCPREASGHYEEVIVSLLTPAEKKRKEKQIKTKVTELNKLFFGKIEKSLTKVLQSINSTSPTHITMNKILAGTKFSNLLRGNVIYLDEYINSGVTVSNTYNLLKCFNPYIKADIVTYHTFVDREELNTTMISSLHTVDEGVRAFLPGAYPYENRIDIIGCYYVRDEKTLKIVTLKDLALRYKKILPNKPANCDFLDKCLFFIENKGLLQILNSKLKIKGLIESKVIDTNEIVRYLLYIFEEDLSISVENTELLWNLFDMFGPSWSPLPKDYHFDFWEGFSHFKQEITPLPEFKSLNKDYKKYRKSLLKEIMYICNKRYKKWQSNIKNIINK